ncbi:MAG: Hsp20/alpha crystallin family protein [Gammaproteobacteria bacterium]
MKKIIFVFLCCLSLINTAVANESISAKKQPKDHKNLIVDPFDDDPFFASQKNLMSQMKSMQEAMDQFMKNQFLQMHNNMVNQDQQPSFGNENNIQITENNKELVYKIKLPKNSNSKVDASIKDNQLILGLNVSQKIMHEQDNSKSISYSQSNYTQSFQLPTGYDPKSMRTQMKDSNLIVTFQKLH